MPSAGLLLALALLLPQAPAARGAAPQERQVVTAAALQAAIDKLGTVDYPVRTEAARTVRRAPAAMAAPALARAVEEHTDGYVRFRALVLLSGFNDPRTHDVMIDAAASPNDRLRSVAYSYFEHNPDPRVVPRLLGALAREESEFVRPALTRALAAHGGDARARDVMNGLVMKGQDFFRSGVIEALGDYKAAYALPNLTEVAKLDGPLQDDAVLAIGKIGDKASLAVLAGLQRSAPRNVQPSIAAAICLLGVNCASHQSYLEQTLAFAIANLGFQDLLRATASGLAALAIAGNTDAASALINQGVATRDPERSPLALALGAVALRNTSLILKALEAQPDTKPGLLLLRDAFDMLEEAFEEERFFVAVRRGYWQAAEDSPSRRVATALIQMLEF
jgi:HEAT repeat protein